MRVDVADHLGTIFRVIAVRCLSFKGNRQELIGRNSATVTIM